MTVASKFTPPQSAKAILRRNDSSLARAKRRDGRRITFRFVGYLKRPIFGLRQNAYDSVRSGVRSEKFRDRQKWRLSAYSP
jgi:hypothetical protein